MNLKKTLKTVKLNESSISMVLGAVILVIVGVLVVNYFRKDGGQIVPAQSTEESEMTAPKKGERYVIKKGDTLWSIAEKAYGSGYNWVDISYENNLVNPGLIEEGQELTIPETESRLGTVIDQEISEPETDTYTVSKGDSLWNIAVNEYGDGLRWVDIARENNLVNPDLIHTGNILTLPR